MKASCEYTRRWCFLHQMILNNLKSEVISFSLLFPHTFLTNYRPLPIVCVLTHLRKTGFIYTCGRLSCGYQLLRHHFTQQKGPVHKWNILIRF